MAISAKVATGVQAIEVTTSVAGRPVQAIITREALEERWRVGPCQEDLLATFLDHIDEIEAVVMGRMAKQGKSPFVICTFAA